MFGGGGVLFYAKYRGIFYFLLGQERTFANYKDSLKFSDFGGGSNNCESHYECALRESYEETMGLFGSQQDYAAMIDKRKCIKSDSYTSYLVKIPFDTALPTLFENIYKHFMYVFKEHHLEIPEGIIEKRKIQWFTADEIRDPSNAYKFRSFYRKMFIDQIDKVKL